MVSRSWRERRSSSDERDAIVNPIGVKELGEIGIVGVTAAVGNAVFHVPGRRIRDLPITPDKLS
jgi:xanthine dehydrogenase YagR molybdenum-binding subunit